MADLKIGWVAGWNSAQDRPLQFVRTAVQGELGDYQLVTVPGGVIRPGLPVILDITANGYDIRTAIKQISSGQFRTSYLIIHRSGWLELDPSLVEDLEVHLYRDALNVRPIVKKFIEGLEAAKKLESDFSVS